MPWRQFFRREDCGRALDSGNGLKFKIGAKKDPHYFLNPCYPQISPPRFMPPLRAFHKSMPVPPRSFSKICDRAIVGNWVGDGRTDGDSRLIVLLDLPQPPFIQAGSD